MEMEYEAMRAATWIEMTALKAAAEPMLISDRIQVIRHVSVTALAGMCSVGCTRPIQSANGRPRSRAKANVWRDVDALKEMLLAMTSTRSMMVSALTPLVETAFWKT